MPESPLDSISFLIERGGVVMVPLVAMSIISLALILERSWFWIGTLRRERPGRLRDVHRALRQGRNGDLEAALQGSRSPCAVVARRLVADGSSDAVALEAVEAERPRLERFMVSLSAIVTAAPLLGILGTVLGIIRSFRLLDATAELTDPSEVVGGIASALLTTALGLIIALMTLFPFLVFRSHESRAIGRLESVIAAAQSGDAGDDPRSRRS